MIGRCGRAVIARRAGTLTVAVVMAIYALDVRAEAVLTLKNLRADLEVIPEDRVDFSVAVDENGTDDPAPVVTRHNGKLTIEGSIPTEVKAFRVSRNLDPRLDSQAFKDRWRQPLSHPEHLAHIVVHAPSRLTIRSTADIFGHVGPSHQLQIDDNGAGRWTVDDVDGTVEINGNGRSHFVLGNALLASIGLMGTGSLSILDVRRLLVGVYGSGDITVRSVTTDAEITVGGIGDLMVQSISGKLRVDIEDAGHVVAHSGELALLKVRTLDGLGSVDFGGTAKEADISIGTRADVHVHRVTGTLKQHLRQNATLRIDER